MAADSPEAVMVHDKSNGNGTRADVGTGVLLHGLMSMLSEVLDGLDRRLGAMESSLAAVEARAGQATDERLEALERRLGDLERGMGEAVDRATGRALEAAATAADRAEDAVEAAVDRAASAYGERAAALEASIAAVLARLASLEDNVQASVGERVGALESALAEERAKAEAEVARLASHVAAAVGEVKADATAALADVAARVEASGQAAATRMAELDATVAAARAETAALPSAVAGQVDDVVARALSGWRNRLRKGEADEGLRRLIDPVAEQLARVHEAVGVLRAEAAGHADAVRRELAPLGDQVTRVHEAVNRSQGESLRAAEALATEIRELVAAGGKDEEILDAVAAVAEQVVALPAALDPGRLTGELRTLRDAVERAREDAGARLAELGEAVESGHERLGAALDTARAGVTAAVNGTEDRLAAAVAGTEDRLASAVGGTENRLAAAVEAAHRELAAAAHGLPELVRTLLREASESSRPKLAADVRAALEPALARLEDATGGDRVVEAIDKAAQEQQEVLNALHASLSKRFDARARSLADTIEHLGTSLESARKLAPVLERVGARLDAQQPFLDQLRHQLLQLSATMAAVPADVERRHGETVAALERTGEALATLRRHAAELDKAVQAMRASQEAVAAAVAGVQEGQAIIPARLDELAASLAGQADQ